MALLPEDMGCAGTDPAGDMAVQRVSERREKEKGTGIPEAVPRDDTVSVGSIEHGLFGRKCILRNTERIKNPLSSGDPDF